MTTILSLTLGILAGCDIRDSDSNSGSNGLLPLGSVVLNAAVAFETGADIQDMAANAQGDRLYTLEFDFMGQAWLKTFQIASHGQLTLSTEWDLGTVMNGSLANDLTWISDSCALVVAQFPVGGSSGAESVHALDPRSPGSSVSSVVLTATPVQAPFVDMAGDSLTLIAESGDTLSAVSISLAEDAVLYQGRLYVATANVAFSLTSIERHPGTILVYGFDAATCSILSRQGVIYTGKTGNTASGIYNLNKLKIAQINGRDVLLAASAGSYSQDAFLEVFDLSTHHKIGEVAVPGAPVTDIAVNEATGAVFLGDALASRIHGYTLQVNLLTGTPPAHAVLLPMSGSPFLLPDGFGGDTWSVGGLALSSGGKRLAATNFRSNRLSIYSLSSGTPQLLTTTSVVHDTLSLSSQRSVALVVRPGTPGQSFRGPDLFMGSIDIDPSAQSLPGVGSAIDAAYGY